MPSSVARASPAPHSVHVWSVTRTDHDLRGERLAASRQVDGRRTRRIAAPKRPYQFSPLVASDAFMAGEARRHQKCLALAGRFPPRVDREFAEQLHGRRLRVTTNFQRGFDWLLHRTVTASLAFSLVAFTVMTLVEIGAVVLLSLVWPAGPHEVPDGYDSLTVAVVTLPVVVVLGLNLVLAIVGNLRGVIVPVVSGVAAALLAGFITVIASGTAGDVDAAVRSAWVGLPTALAAAIVSAVQRPRPAD
jgi:hypothetical protein